MPSKEGVLMYRYLSIVMSMIVCMPSFGLSQSLDSQGPSRLTAGANRSSNSPVTSVNGRFVAFRSRATNLVAPSTNGQDHIFLRDLSLGTTSLITSFIPFDFGFTVPTFGCPNPPPTAPEEANGSSGDPALSPVAPNGFVALAFESNATNLSNFCDTGAGTDIFVYLPGNEVFPSTFLERITFGVPPAGSVAPTEANGSSTNPSVTIVPEPNRAFVAYSSTASNMVSGISDSSQRDVFLSVLTAPTSVDGFDLDLVDTQRISNTPEGDEPNGVSDNAVISGNAACVVFESNATDLVEDLTPTGTQLYLYRVEDQTIELVSRTPSGDPGDGDSSGASISYNCSFIVYQTQASDIVSDVSSGEPVVVRYNVKTGQAERINVNGSGEGGDGTTSNLSARIAGNGRFVVFSDNSSNLVSDDTNGATDVFIKDVSGGSLTRASVDVDGEQGNASSTQPVIGADSYNTTEATVSFRSNANNLVAGDTEGNGDIFSRVATLNQRVLRRRDSIEVPADVTTRGRKALRVQMENFSGVDLTKAGVQPLSIQEMRRKRVSVRYEARAQSLTRRKDRRRAVSRRNTITFKGLRPGTYRVTYRARIRSGRRTVSRSSFSPPERIRVGPRR